MMTTIPMNPIRPVEWRSFQSRLGSHLLVLRGSQILDVADDDLLSLSDADLSIYLDEGNRLNLGLVPSVAPQNLSLNLTSACNLACDYCYAGQGTFGGAQSGAMSTATSEQAIDTLFAGCDRRSYATIGFLGGEPFLHRRLLHYLVDYTTRRAAEVGQRVGFSVTTNATVLEEADLELLRSNRFAVTVSLDGGRAVHDRRRVWLAGQGSWDDAMARIRPLLADPGAAQICARATLTADDLDLMGRHDALAAEGFQSIGFAPVRVGAGALADTDWPLWLDASIDLAERELAVLRRGGQTSFDNFSVALRRLESGSSSPYPCGAGGGYASVATDGQWYACHRAIGDEDYRMGNTEVAVDPVRQHQFLESHHVDNVEPCRSCWARYLCSGGCHQEASTRTDAACDAIRSWLEFCLDAYCVVSSERPEWFAKGGS